MRTETYKLMKHLEKAKNDYFEKNSLEGAYFKVEITIKEVTSDLETITNELKYIEKR